MQDIVELQENFEKSEIRKNELENQIEIMRTDLLKAQKSLTRLEQFESEKLRMKEDLEVKIEEYNMLTEHYQHEKESYLHVLEHIQDQVNIYKDQSQKFDAEKGSWSKQIDELKAELAQTKATLVKMAELEQKNGKLSAELQEKEMEIYKMKKENDRALEQQMEQFKTELKKYHDKIVQYEKDREIWEKQMRQMKAQFAGLESNLEERENYIKQFIIQPLSQITPEAEVLGNGQQQVMEKPEETLQIESSKPIPKHQSQQPADWFQRVMTQQKASNQSVPQKSKSSNPATMDFFTLRSKTTQSSIPGSTYGNQWNQE